nr:melanoma inhibitory activity protein 2-like [Nerophis lumbriciformis]
MFLVILPQLSRGLLSEFKICGDSECESLMSRVQAVRDHRGRDCRFLSFQQGETIFVYHKLTGKRSNLWAGSINKKFGYFPKETVKEEQKFARKEIVVPTQESDFLCVDDFGYPIDSSHLETDDDVNGDDSDLSQLEDIEMSQRSNYTNEENAETSSKSKDTTTESDTSEEELENPETAVDVQEKGGSPPSSWLNSPVTGWLGLGQQEEPDNSAESKKKHLMREEESLTSSVTGWLGLRSEGKSDNANHGQQDGESIKSLPSTMTGWLGFGGEEKADFSAEKVHDGAREIDIETAPEDNFRSRKMYLETQKVTGWLGNGLSKTLGFDLSEQDNGETIQVSREEGEKDEKETAFRSWFDLGIRNILAFKKDNSETGGIASDTEPEDVVRGHVNSDDNNIEDSTTNTKDSELDSTSQHDQDVNPLENQKVVIDLVQDAKDGENKFDHLGSKNDVTPLTVFTDMKSRSMQQSMSKIEDSQKDQLDIRDEAEFTNQVQNTDNSNISFVYGASDEKHKVLRRDEEILKLEASVDQSKVQESGSANEKQEEVNDKEQNKDIDEQKYLDDNQKNIEEILPNRLHETIQDEFNESATHENWKVSDANKDEENNHLELNVDYLIMRDKEFTDENLSGKDTEKHSSHWSTPTENGKEMETQDLQGTEVSFVSSLAPKADEKESIDEKRDVLSEEEKQKEMKLTEEQEFSQVLVEKQKETVERKEDMQKDFTPSEKEEPLEELQVKPLEDLTDMEQLHFKKNGELLEEGKQGNVAALKEVRRSINMKKHAVEDELIKEIEEKKQEMLITSIEEIEEKNHVKLGSFIEKGNVEDFEDEKEETIESGEGKKHEVVEPVIETKQEVVEQNIGEFIYRQVGKLDDKNYELNGELVKELGDRQEESRERFEKKDELDGESEEELENKWQEEFKDRERDNVENLEKYDANGELADKLEEKYEVFGESIETFEKKRQGALKDEEQDRLVKLEKYEVQGESVEKLENEEYVELKVKKQEDEGKLEEKGYMLSCELQEKRQEELEDRGQKVEEKKHRLDCEMEDKIQEDLEQTLEDKYEVDRESAAKFENKKQEQFKENEREDVQTLEKYEADDEPVEKIEKKETLEETKVKLQEEMKLLDETYEVIGQSVGMFEDKSQEDPEHKEQDESNEFELDKYEDLNPRVLQEEFDENRNGGARNWKHVEELEEDGTWDGFVQANEEVKQEFNGDVKVVSSLPDDMRPGPDLYGIPWEPIVISSLVGLVTVFLFSCRFYRSVKSRMYQRKEWWMAEKVAQLLEEKCEVLETLGKCQQEYDELENSLKDGGVLAQTHKTRDLEVRAQQLDIDKTQLEKTLLELKDQLDQQKAHRIEQEQKITLLEQSMEKTEEETKELQSQEEQAQTTIKVYNMNCERLQKNLETSSEENTLLKESNTQLRQQVEGWAERVSELEEEIRRYELAHNGMMQDVANKDERIMSLTDRLLGMKAWDADLEGDRSVTSKGTTGKERNGKVDATKSEVHLQKVQKLIYAAKLNADLKSVDEDKDRVFAKLNDEVKAKEDLEVSIKELENEQSSMQAETEHYSEQVQRLQQKLQIMTEMYQENELKLHRLLTVEEKERLQKEDKLNKADKNIALAMEELNNYKLRAGEMEEELEKTKQSYQTQISAHEKKAHNNWLAARAADRELSDIKRENSLLRQKITDTQFKLDALDKDPFALDSLARPLPFRAERLPYGPSPLGRPASENRALLSPPTLVEGALNRLSPRVTRGPDTGVQGEMERFGGPHSDSGSISPSWEKDRRGPPPGPPGPFPPPGYVFPEPGGPIYRRPGPPPGVMGPLPPPGPPFPHPRSHPILGPSGPVYPADTSDGISRENSLGPEHNHREPGPGDRRTPPESVLRMGVAPPLGPSMGPLDGPFPRRAPFEPPDFFPPRGPGGPPMMPMWAPRPGMMFPPRYPHGGPLQPHPLAYGPPMRPPPTDGLPPLSTVPPISQQNLSSVPHSQSLDDQTSPP